MLLREPQDADKMPGISVTTVMGEKFRVIVDEGATVLDLAGKIAEQSPRYIPDR